MDEKWALIHDILLELSDLVLELSDPHTIYALEGYILSKIHHATTPVSLTYSGNHQETISFFICHSSLTPIMLGHPWLTQHSMQSNWVEGTILSWGLSCHVKCLVSAMPAVFRCYRKNLVVFLGSLKITSQATSLPPHRPYHCSIDLVPGSMPPCSHLYFLSTLKCEALEKHLSNFLAASTIAPSTSTSGAGFF